MDIILLHSAMVGASRDLLASLGVTIPEGDDVTVAVGSDTVRIISKHSLAVAAVPAFPGYPAAAVTVDGKQYVLPFPTTWAEVTAWVANPAPENTKVTAITNEEFLKRFTQTELLAILNAQSTDTTIQLFMLLFNAASYIDLEDSLVVSAVNHMVSANLLTSDRGKEILTP